MKYALPLTILATPAIAHNGAHLHPHDSSLWMVGLGLIALSCGLAFAKSRLAMSEKSQ